MKLTEFRVTNYRSVNDSGPIEVRDRTVLVGRNESGKTNLLLALQSLNPAEGVKKLEMVRDLPRDRHPKEFTADLPVLQTRWELTGDEQRAIAEIFPRASGVTAVEVTRPYAARRDVSFVDLPPLVVPLQEVEKHLSELSAGIDTLLQGVDPAAAATVNQDLIHLRTEPSNPLNWATQIPGAVARLRKSLTKTGVELPPTIGDPLTSIERLAGSLISDRDAEPKAMKWVTDHLPVFVYLTEYPQLSGHQHIGEYLERQREKRPQQVDVDFGKLCKVAGLDPKRLHELLDAGDADQRNMWANRASAHFSKVLEGLWKDRPLKVRFNLDSHYFDTFVSDPTAGYDVEVNLNDRSRGFRWFFSFYATFAADTMGGPYENAILLLDEPGLHLHASSQRDLLEHFKQFKNQIIFTTHSPFMIPMDELDTVRTVSARAEGTTVTNDPAGDEKTLFPLQSALGYVLTQTLFVGEKNLVVEGVTDFWYLYAVSEHLRDRGDQTLPEDLVVTPAGGAHKVPYMVALLSAQELRVLVLLDGEPEAQRAAEEMVRAKLIRDDYVAYATEAFLQPPEGGADTEDLLGPESYDALVREAYADELEGKSLALNPRVPRLVKRYEHAFDALGLEFHKSRPARLFLRTMGVTPEKVLQREAQERFQRLFSAITQRLERLERRDRGQFEIPKKFD